MSKLGIFIVMFNGNYDKTSLLTSNLKLVVIKI